jgi:dihydrofolate reductase
MRKIVAGLFVSLDGVAESPSKWGYPYFDAEVLEAIAAGVTDADAILIGRRTYLEFAELWPSREGPMAEFLNGTHKHVASGTLDRLDWGPASLIGGDLAAELAELKRQPGRNIQVPGSPRLVAWLLRHGLLDELDLMTAPTLVGSGTRLFEESGEPIGLELVESRSFDTGVVAANYRTVLDRSHPEGAR